MPPHFLPIAGRIFGRHFNSRLNQAYFGGWKASHTHTRRLPCLACAWAKQKSGSGQARTQQLPLHKTGSIPHPLPQDLSVGGLCRQISCLASLALLQASLSLLFSGCLVCMCTSILQGDGRDSDEHLLQGRRTGLACPLTEKAESWPGGGRILAGWLAGRKQTAAHRKEDSSRGRRGRPHSPSICVSPNDLSVAVSSSDKGFTSGSPGAGRKSLLPPHLGNQSTSWGGRRILHTTHLALSLL